jgi:hypothetical protein
MELAVPVPVVPKGKEEQPEMPVAPWVPGSSPQGHWVRRELELPVYYVFGPVSRTRALRDPRNPAIPESLFDPMNGVPYWLVKFLHEGKEPDFRSIRLRTSGETEGAAPSSCASAPPNWGVCDMAGGSEVLREVGECLVERCLPNPDVPDQWPYGWPHCGLTKQNCEETRPVQCSTASLMTEGVEGWQMSVVVLVRL